MGEEETSLSLGEFKLANLSREAVFSLDSAATSDASDIAYLFPIHV